MESSKANQTRWNDITLLSYHPYNLSHFANYAHHKTHCMHIMLFYSYPINAALSTAHSTAFHILKDDPYLPCPAAIQFHSNLYSNMPYRHSIAHELHNFHIAKRETISAMHSSDYIQQPPTTPPTLHTQLHALPPSTAHSTAFPCPRQPFCASNKHKA